MVLCHQMARRQCRCHLPREPRHWEVGSGLSLGLAPNDIDKGLEPELTNSASSGIYLMARDPLASFGVPIAWNGGAILNRGC